MVAVLIVVGLAVIVWWMGKNPADALTESLPGTDNRVSQGDAVDAGDTGDSIPRPLHDCVNGIAVRHGGQPSINGKPFIRCAQTQVCCLHRSIPKSPH